MSFDIEKLYKENIDSSVPDMDKLWDRIENRLDEQEKADSKTEHHNITPSARPKRKLVSLIAVAACAVIAVTGAFVIMNGNKLSTDSSSANSTRNASDKNVPKKASGEMKFNEDMADNADDDKNLAIRSDEAGGFAPEQTDNAEEIEAVNNEAEDTEENTAQAAAPKSEGEQSPSVNNKTGSTSATAAAGDNTAASDAVQSADKDISKQVEDRVNELLESEEYLNADASHKAELVTALFDELTEEGAVTSYSVDESADRAYCEGNGFAVSVTLGI